MSESQKPAASTLQQCLLLLGATVDQSSLGGQRDPLNPDMDWRWHFQVNVRDLPCSVQSEHDLNTPWQLLHDLQRPAQQAGYAISLLPLEATASFAWSGTKFTWPDDDPVDVRQFAAAFASCFPPNISAFRLGYFPEEEGEEVVCVLLSRSQVEALRTLLGCQFERIFKLLAPTLGVGFDRIF